MKKRYYAFVGAAGVLALVVVLAIASVVSAETPTPTPPTGGKNGPRMPAIQRRAGAINKLRQIAQGAGGLEVINVNGATILAQARGGIVTIVTDANTKFRVADRDASVKDVTPGSVIKVQGQRDANGKLVAGGVQVIPPHATGQISAYDGNSGSMTLKQGNASQAVKLAADTGYYLAGQKADAKVVQVGRRAEVVGTVATDGTITAMVVRIEPDRVAGVVGSVSGNTFTVTRGALSTTVTTDAQTKYFNGTAAAQASDVAAGKIVVVEGFKSTDGRMTATAVRIAPNTRTPRRLAPSAMPKAQ